MTDATLRRMIPAAITALVLVSGLLAGPFTSADARGDESPTDGDNPAYTFTLKFDHETPIYYDIESEFRDSGGVPPLLSYTASIKDRRTITQRTNSPSSQPIAMPGSGLLSLVWKCDRYEAREQNMKEEAVYDSNRHLYPPGSLRELEAIAGSTTAFLLNPVNGEVSNITIVPAMITCPIPRRGSMGKTVERCTLTPTNMKVILEALGASWLPKAPKRVGESWTISSVEPQTNIGAIHINTRCTLKSVREFEGRKVAVVDIASEMTLESLAPTPPPVSPVLINPANEATSQPTTQAAQVISPPANQPMGATTSQPGAIAAATSQPGATTRPIAYPRPPQKQNRDFRLDKGAYSGTVEFDLTNGRPMQVSIRKEINLVADVDSQSMGKMQLRTGTAQLLKIRALSSAPTLPPIVGGKVVPKLTDAEKAILDQLKKAPPPTTQPATNPNAAANRNIRGSSAGRGIISSTDSGGTGPATPPKTKRGPVPQTRRPPTSRPGAGSTTRPAGRNINPANRS